MPAKCHLNGASLTGRWWSAYTGIWILPPLISIYSFEPSSTKKKKKTLSKSDLLWQNFLDPRMQTVATLFLCRRGSEPPLENQKLSFLLVRTSFEEQFGPPSPLELSGSVHACLTVEFNFLHVAGSAIILSRANWCVGWSAPLLFAYIRNGVNKANPDKMLQI